MKQVMVLSLEAGGYEVVVEQDDGGRYSFQQFHGVIFPVIEGMHWPDCKALANAVCLAIAAVNPGIPVWCAE